MDGSWKEFDYFKIPLKAGRKPTQCVKLHDCSQTRDRWCHQERRRASSINECLWASWGRWKKEYTQCNRINMACTVKYQETGKRYTNTSLFRCGKRAVLIVSRHLSISMFPCSSSWDVQDATLLIIQYNTTRVKTRDALIGYLEYLWLNSS